MKNLRQSTKPLVGNSVATSTDPLSVGAKKGKPAAAPVPTAYGQTLTTPASPAPVPLPGLNSALSSALTASQNQANNANNQRYGQGLGVLAGGQTTQQGDITAAMGSVANNTQAQQTLLGENLQAAQGKATQSATSRGLGDTTIANTMQDLPTRQYNDAMNQLAGQQSQITAGLQTQAGQAAAQGSGTIANYIAGRTDAGPNTGQYAQLAQQAANKPASIAQAASNIGGSGRSAPAPIPPKGGGGETPSGPGGYFQGAGVNATNMGPSTGGFSMDNGSDAPGMSGTGSNDGQSAAPSISGSMGGGASFDPEDPGFG